MIPPRLEVETGGGRLRPRLFPVAAVDLRRVTRARGGSVPLESLSAEWNAGGDGASVLGAVPEAPGLLAATLLHRLRAVLRHPALPRAHHFRLLEWPAPLFDYQVQGIAALVGRPALLLADDMGLGKTIQAVAALRVLAARGELDAALVVVPTPLVGQWRRELRAWAPELRVSVVRGPAAERGWMWQAPAEVYLTSYETLRADATDNPQSPPRRRVWDVLVLDEAQRIKNRDTEVSRRAKELRRRRTWALSGTPLENRVEELASLLEAVVPAPEGGPPGLLLPGPRLRARQAEVQLRRRKAEVLTELPPKLVRNLRLPMEGEQRASYERAEREGVVALRRAGAELRVESVLALIVRLKQICNACPRTGQSAKLQDLRERVAVLRAEGHRALVFSQFTDAVHGTGALAAALAEHRPLLYTGALSAAERERVLERFRGSAEHGVLILSLRAGGQGLNLQDASYVFHFDRWWNPAVERQAEARAHRLGQRVPVHVYTYTLRSTIEERIATLLARKQALFDRLVDDVSLDLASSLSARELYGLFGLAGE